MTIPQKPDRQNFIQSLYKSDDGIGLWVAVNLNELQVLKDILTINIFYKKLFWMCLMTAQLLGAIIVLSLFVIFIKPIYQAQSLSLWDICSIAFIDIALFIPTVYLVFKIMWAGVTKFLVGRVKVVGEQAFVHRGLLWLLKYINP